MTQEIENMLISAGMSKLRINELKRDGLLSKIFEFVVALDDYYRSQGKSPDVVKIEIDKKIKELQDKSITMREWKDKRKPHEAIEE